MELLKNANNDDCILAKNILKPACFRLKRNILYWWGPWMEELYKDNNIRVECRTLKK